MSFRHPGVKKIDLQEWHLLIAPNQKARVKRESRGRGAERFLFHAVQTKIVGNVEASENYSGEMGRCIVRSFGEDCPNDLNYSGPPEGS